VRAQPGRLVGQFPLRTDRPAEHGSEQQAAEQLEVAWHVAECYPLGGDGGGVG
jgi:hypothetical protein